MVNGVVPWKKTTDNIKSKEAISYIRTCVLHYSYFAFSPSYQLPSSTPSNGPVKRCGTRYFPIVFTTVTPPTTQHLAVSFMPGRTTPYRPGKYTPGPAIGTNSSPGSSKTAKTSASTSPAGVMGAICKASSTSSITCKAWA